MATLSGGRQSLTTFALSLQASGRRSQGELSVATRTVRRTKRLIRGRLDCKERELWLRASIIHGRARAHVGRAQVGDLIRVAIGTLHSQCGSIDQLRAGRPDTRAGRQKARSKRATDLRSSRRLKKAQSASRSPSSQKQRNTSANAARSSTGGERRL